MQVTPVLQASDCVLAPSHVLPPAKGAGLVHVRLLCLIPVSHVTEQLPYAPHKVQAPFTMLEYIEKKLFRHFNKIL